VIPDGPVWSWPAVYGVASSQDIHPSPGVLRPSDDQNLVNAGILVPANPGPVHQPSQQADYRRSKAGGGGSPSRRKSPSPNEKATNSPLRT
jgi:hypothetical protein